MIFLLYIGLLVAGVHVLAELLHRRYKGHGDTFTYSDAAASRIKWRRR